MSAEILRYQSARTGDLGGDVSHGRIRSDERIKKKAMAGRDGIGGNVFARQDHDSVGSRSTVEAKILRAVVQFDKE